MENRVIVDGVEIINDMTFKEFKESSKNDETLQIQFSPLFSDERKFIKGKAKLIFHLFLFSYMYLPVILIPFFSYYYSNWYLLFGLLFSSISIYFALRKNMAPWAAPLIFMIWYWYQFGFHLNYYINFFWLCTFWGGFFCRFTISIEEVYAKIEILNDEELFNRLSEEKIIFAMRKAK